MANNIYSPGTVTILTSTSTGSGSWYRLHPNVRNVTFQGLANGSSVGVTAASAINIEASNDGTNALATKLGTITLNGAAPYSDGFTVDAHWEYVRATITAITTADSTCSVIASAQFGK